VQASSPGVGPWQLWQSCEFWWNGGISWGIYSDASKRWVTNAGGWLWANDTCVCGAAQLFTLFANYYGISLGNERFLADDPGFYDGIGAFYTLPEGPAGFYFGWLFAPE
jgi:hypothetical protein